ncbi:MAG: hypothetical protein JOY77_12405 [Alphaproteobacteria bacterium]|nr:hypothetical protein [Alphaproteobacteria bacterium]
MRIHFGPGQGVRHSEFSATVMRVPSTHYCDEWFEPVLSFREIHVVECEAQSLKEVRPRKQNAIPRIENGKHIVSRLWLVKTVHELSKAFFLLHNFQRVRPQLAGDPGPRPRARSRSTRSPEGTGTCAAR